MSLPSVRRALEWRHGAMALRRESGPCMRSDRYPWWALPSLAGCAERARQRRRRQEFTLHGAVTEGIGKNRLFGYPIRADRADSCPASGAAARLFAAVRDH